MDKNIDFDNLSPEEIEDWKEREQKELEEEFIKYCLENPDYCDDVCRFILEEFDDEENDEW